MDCLSNFKICYNILLVKKAVSLNEIAQVSPACWALTALTKNIGEVPPLAITSLLPFYGQRVFEIA